MRDPGEGRTPDGMITTGARRKRIAAVYEPVLAAAAERIASVDPSVSVIVYGSVATGQAQPPESDVDLLVVGLPGPVAEAIGSDMSSRFSDLCREVAVAHYPQAHLHQDGDAAYGDRAFLRHYCVHLAGPDHTSGWPPFPADVRAARGFNGDIAMRARSWRRALDTVAPENLGRGLSRKTLLAVAGLVSIHDQTWTTDRGGAARRWSDLHPQHGPDLATLLSWSDGRTVPDGPAVRQALDGIVQHVVTAFTDMIGIWR